VKNNRIGNYDVSDAEMNVLAKVFADPILANQFISLLENVKRSNEVLHGKTAQMFLMTDAPAQRAMSLTYKGKAEFAAEMVQLIKQVNK